MTSGWIYIMTDRPNGTLYVGVTDDLVQRVSQHRAGAMGGVTKDYGLTRLVYFERHDDLALAIRHEKDIENWPRAWKENLILSTNPHWTDLFNRLG
jgi:putative endonuclease